MTTTPSTRFGIDTYSVGSDFWFARTGWDTFVGLLEGKAGILLTGTLPTRPAVQTGVTGGPRRFYWATDTQRLYWDTGTAWVEVSPVGGGGTPLAVADGGAGAEGTSRIGARADHKHPEPGWTAIPLAGNFTAYIGGGGAPAFRIVGKEVHLCGAARWTAGGTGIPAAASLIGTGLPAPFGYSARFPLIPAALGKNTAAGSTDPIGFGHLNPRDDGGLRVYKVTGDSFADVVFLDGVFWRYA